MLSNISWGNYIITVLIITGIWYSCIILRFCLPQLKELLSGKKSFTLFSNSSKKGTAASAKSKMFSEFSEPFDTLQDAEELVDKLLIAVAESADRNLSPKEFKNYVRLIFSEFPYVKTSSLRIKINSFMVSECQKYPSFILTDSEADALWDDEFY